MAILNNTGIRAGASGAGGGSSYNVEKSLRFNDDDTAYLSRTPGSAGNRKTWTYSAWIKRSNLSSSASYNILSCMKTTNTDFVDIRFNNDDLRMDITATGQTRVQITSAALFRDPTAWYHIVIAVDTTETAASDRFKLYINNVQQTTTNTLEPNIDTAINSDGVHNIGRRVDGSDQYFDGLMADVHLIDGSALDPSSFAETNADTGQWVPKKYSGPSHGTNGFHLKFNDLYNSSGTIKVPDNSSNSNEWDCSNITIPGTTLNVPCVEFDGTDDYLEIDDHSDFDLGTNDWTLECFVRPFRSTAQVWQSLVMHADNGASYAGSQWWWANNISTNGLSYISCYIYNSAGNAYKVVTSGPTGHMAEGRWAHVAVVRDSDTMRLYVDGVQKDTEDVTGWTMNSCSEPVRIGSDGGGNYDMDGAISNVRIVNGTCLYTQGSSGFTVPSMPLTNVANTKLLCCQSSTSATAATVIPSGTIATSGGPVAKTLSDETEEEDVSDDTPGAPWDNERNGGGNYAVLNPLSQHDTSTTAAHLSEVRQGGSQAYSLLASHYFSSTWEFKTGKWYFEFMVGHKDSPASGQHITIGWMPRSDTHNVWGANTSGYYIMYSTNTQMQRLAAAPNSLGTMADGTGFMPGQTYGIAVDMDSRKVWYTDRDGTWLDDDWATNGNPVTGANPVFNLPGSDPYYLHIDADNAILNFNFGARPFTYTPPTGYKACSVYNIPDPTIADPSKHFGVSTWTADDEDSKDITDLKFKPGMVWGKNRDTAVNNQIFDVVRGAGSGKELTPNLTAKEGNTTDPKTETYGFLSAFNSDGFTVAKGDDGSGYQNYYWNYQTNKHVAWSWNVGTATSNTSVSVGDLNDTLYDQSDDWSGDGTSDGNTNTGQGWDKAFDNERGNYYKGAYTLGSSSSTFTFDPNNKPTWSNKIEVYFRKYDGTANVNGGSDFTTVSEWTTAGVYVEGWYDISSIAGTSGTLSTITTTDVSNNYVAIQSIRLDGKILVDSTVSVADAPSIASDYRVNNDAGFSIVTYTGNAVSGATIAHGLNAKPDFGIFKARETDGYTWYVYHKELGNTHHLYLDGTYAYNDDSGAWNDTDPDSNVMTVGNANPNPSGEDMVAYLWSEVAGYSKFGYYYGNDLDDGAYVSCGFKPAFILIKNANTASTEWVIVDNERDPDNVVKEVLNSNDTTADDNSATIVDFLSNGFKLRSASNRVNESKGSGDPPNFMVYAAFAESPFKYANAR